MKLAALIQKGGLRKAANATVATLATDEPETNRSVATVAKVAVATIAVNDTAETPPDSAAEARRQRLIAMLCAHPEKRYAVLTDAATDPEAVIVALAIRGRATCELRIPRDRYDGTLLLDLIERHGGTMH